MNALRIVQLKLLLLLLVFTHSFVSTAQLNRKQLLDSAEVASTKMNYQRALIFFQDAHAISKKEKNKGQIVADLLNIGKTHTSLDNKEEALKIYLSALRLSDEIKNDSITFEVLDQISTYYLSIESLENAKKHLQQTKALADKLGYLDFQRRYFNSLGVYERKSGNYEASINAYKKCLEFIDPSKLENKFNSFINLSTAYGYNEDLETSYSYLLKAEKLNETLKNEFNSLVLCGQMGRTQFLLGNAKKAIEFYQSGLVKSKEVKNYDMIERFTRELARTHYKLGNYQEAYDYYAAFVIELQNSHDRENATAMAEMSVKYENEKKEQKIQSLEEQQKLKAQIHKTQIDRRNLWILISLLIVFTTIVFTFILLKSQRNKQRLTLELAEQQKELAKQESELKGQELERNRLSRELHDGLGGTLASIKMRLSAQNIDTINPILKDIDGACQDVRNMSHSLSSSFIDEIDFYSLLTKLVEDLRKRSSMIVHLEFMPLDELNRLDSNKKHQCYRIIQELSNNAINHAQASSLTIGLMKNEDDVILLVEDDGVGFEIDAPSTGIGLSNVRMRLETIDGQLEITTKRNVGTTFTINFPFNHD